MYKYAATSNQFFFYMYFNVYLSDKLGLFKLVFILIRLYVVLLQLFPKHLEPRNILYVRVRPKLAACYSVVDVCICITYSFLCLCYCTIIRQLSFLFILIYFSNAFCLLCLCLLLLNMLVNKNSSVHMIWIKSTRSILYLHFFFKNGNTALHMAAKRYNTQIVIDMLDGHCNPNIENTVVSTIWFITI